LKIKSKLLAGTSTLVIAGSMMAAAAPSAHAVVTNVGACTGQVTLDKLTSPVKGQGLGDQTTRGIKVAGALAKDQTSKQVIAGTCSGIYRAGDAHVPTPAVGGGNKVLSTLTPISEAISLLGNSGCANGAGAMAADATAADAYPLNGKITLTFSQTYVDLVTSATKKYTEQTDIAVLGFNTGLGPDVIDVGGIGLTGVNAGTNLSGNIWEDPVSKTGGATGYNTGYEVDIASAAGCADNTPNNANITLVLSGGGGTSANSLLGSSTTGLKWTTGE